MNCLLNSLLLMTLLVTISHFGPLQSSLFYYIYIESSLLMNFLLHSLLLMTLLGKIYTCNIFAFPIENRKKTHTKHKQTNNIK